MAVEAQTAAPRLWGEATASDEGDSLHEVYLRIDGNVAGQVRMFDASGNLKPAPAAVYFLRDGAIVTSTRSDKRGHFQATGLRPGVYSVIAVGRKGFGVRSVAVRPFDQSADAQGIASQVGFTRQTSASLDITLVPAEEFELLAGMLNEELTNVVLPEPAPLPAGTAGGTAGGGGGGGLGGLGGLLGVAGLGAGVVALATQDDAQASPSTP